jgi:hypothetical protein
MNITTDIRISVSASYNRATQIVAADIKFQREEHAEELRNGLDETLLEHLTIAVDKVARAIYAKEQAFLKEIAEDMKPKYTPSPTQKVEPNFRSMKTKKENEEQALETQVLELGEDVQE